MSAHYHDFSTSLISIKPGLHVNLVLSLGWLRSAIGVPETNRSSIGDAQAVLRERGYATEESRREQLVLKRGRVVNNKPALMGGLSSVSKGRRIAN